MFWAGVVRDSVPPCWVATCVCPGIEGQNWGLGLGSRLYGFSSRFQPLAAVPWRIGFPSQTFWPPAGYRLYYGT